VRRVRRARIGRLSIKYERRSRDEFMGRFGGGWNWIVGVEVGGRTVILNCLVFMIRIDWEREEPARKEAQPCPSTD
jgi:hypothetical protein